jgi:hypothetical protein
MTESEIDELADKLRRALDATEELVTARRLRELNQ